MTSLVLSRQYFRRTNKTALGLNLRSPGRNFSSDSRLLMLVNGYICNIERGSIWGRSVWELFSARYGKVCEKVHGLLGDVRVRGKYLMTIDVPGDRVGLPIHSIGVPTGREVRWRIVNFLRFTTKRCVDGTVDSRCICSKILHNVDLRRP